MKLADLVQKTEYRVLAGAPQACELDSLCYDSRKALAGSVFVCLRGSRLDAHRFIPSVLAQGCRLLVVEGFESIQALADWLSAELGEEGSAAAGLLRGGEVCVLSVVSSRAALAYMSAAYFGYPAEKLCTVAITGTKGKTTSSWMLKHILECAGKRVGLIGTNGIDICGDFRESKNTTPESYELHQLFAQMVEAGCTHMIMEASSQGFKLDRTAGINFDYGIFTNIEPDHIGPDEHADFEEYRYFKSFIFRQSKLGLLNLDAQEAAYFQAQARCPLYSFAVDREADFRTESLQFVANADFVGTAFVLCEHGAAAGEVRVSLPGRYNVANAMAALSAARLMGVELADIQRALAETSVNGRMETVFKNKDFSVIVDYAHNAMAMKNLLETLRHYQPGRLVLVFGCGGNRAKDRRYGMGEMAGKMADLSILTADNSRYERTEDIIADIKSTLIPTGGQYVEIPDRREAIEYAMANAQPGDMIAVIGKGHEDYNEVNGVRTHFLDREVVAETARKLGLQ